MNQYLLSLILLVTIGCQTIDITKQSFACDQLDWFEIGRSDGVQGLDSQSYLSKKKNCENFSQNNHESYVNGWYAGVDEFCSIEHGFAYGRSGHKYLKVCPPSKETVFLTSYRKGMEVYEYELKNQEITNELEKIAKSSDSKQPGSLSAELIKRSTELETQLELNKALISEIQRDVDESLSKEQSL